MAITDTMPKWECHKTVWALRIRDVDPVTDGGAFLHFYAPDDGWPQPPPLKVEAAYVIKHNPQAQGYFIVYEDGYQSWSPAEAFEAGYTRAPT